MNIRQAISKYRESIHDACYNLKPFTIIGCSWTCGCVKGLKFEDIEFYDQTIRVKNGYKFRLSVDLANQLENEMLPVIQPARLGHTNEQRNQIKKVVK